MREREREREKRAVDTPYSIVIHWAICFTGNILSNILKQSSSHFWDSQLSLPDNSIRRFKCFVMQYFGDKYQNLFSSM